MDSLQEVSEVSSTMAEESEVLIEIEVSQPQKGISLAEAANALITLQVPSKEPTPPSAISCSRDNDSKPVIAEGNPKEVRKRILEGMKSQFNTSNEEEAGLEQSNRRGPHRSKSKFKRHENEEDSAEVVIKPETPKSSRGRGRPPRVSQIDKPLQPAPDTLKVEADIIRSEIDSSSEAGSERSDSASGTTTMMTTRRSQRTNISRTSATELLKGGLAETRSPSKKPIISTEPELVKPLDLPRKRGRPCKSTVVLEAKNADTIIVGACEEIIVEDVSKVVHMASLGLQSKSSPDQSTTVHPPETSPILNAPGYIHDSRPTSKKLRMDGLPTKCISTPEKEPLHSFSLNLDDSPSSDSLVLETSAQSPVNNVSVTDECTLVANSLENEVELSIVEVQGKHEATNGPTSRQVNGTVSSIVEKNTYACSCVESRPPVAIVPPAATLYCQAVDSVGGKLVGCCLVANRKRFYRPSKKIQFMILCDSHRDRIRKHFCCPGCGLFCTQVSMIFGQIKK